MKTRLYLCALLLVVLAAPASAQKYEMRFPKSWVHEWVPNKNDAARPPASRFTSSADRISANVGIAPGLDARVLSKVQMAEVVTSMAEDWLPSAVETKPVVKPFGANGSGVYLRLTQKDSKAPFRYSTFAINRIGPLLWAGVLFSNDEDGSQLSNLFGVLESITTASATPAPAAAPAVMPAPATAAKPAVAAAASPMPGDKTVALVAAWGAIATNAVAGDAEPDYGIGGGDSQAEAEKNALRFCRENGAKRCTLRVSYTQCGAFATSGTVSGSGIGASKKAAEQQALGACKDSDCSVLTSDCN